MQVEKLKTIDADTLLSTPMNKIMFIVDGHSAGRECDQRSLQDRKKLADAVARLTSIVGTFRVGSADQAM